MKSAEISSKLVVVIKNCGECKGKVRAEESMRGWSSSSSTDGQDGSRKIFGVVVVTRRPAL